MIPEETTRQVIEIARAAARAILTIYESDFTVNNKKDNSPLTQADLIAHQTITKGLTALTPNLPILSEESTIPPWDKRKHWRQYWLIDPLDGTREFIKRNGEFTVNIALIEDHLPVIGVVYVPVGNVCYYASRDHGAYKITGTSTSAIQTRKTDMNHIAVCGSRSHGNKKQQAFIKSLGQQSTMIAIGSSLKFCLVAEGSADVYLRFGLTSEWDTAAAHCIVNEAGGAVLDMHDQPLCYNDTASLLNPEFMVIGDKHFDWQPYLNSL